MEDLDIFSSLVFNRPVKQRAIEKEPTKGLTGDQLHFLTSRSIPFLKHWPIECLATNPQACMFHFFG